MQFSIVIPYYNKERHIERTIKSVLNQSIQSFEIIIVDDGSTDNGIKKVKELKDKRIRVLHQENQGVSVARNNGIKNCSYDYIALLDADDEWESNFLSEIEKLINKYSNCGAYITEVKPYSKKSGNSYGYLENEYLSEGIINDYFKSALKSPVISASSVVIPKRIFKELGMFKVGMARGEDLEMWCRISLKYDIAYTKKSCAIYHQDTDNRACLKKYSIEESFVNDIDKLIDKYNVSEKKSEYFFEYINRMLITKARYKIRNKEKKEARYILLKIKNTQYFKKLYLKTYLLTYLPDGILKILLK